MTKTQHGYVLVYVGKKHHLADCRGYAYLHRVNAEKKIGRRLLPEEEVHHDDGNRDNNNEDNLIVKKNHAHHFLEHRKRSDLKHPDEPNYYIECFCGCGEKLLKYDESNRPRMYIVGHNPIAAPLKDRILNILKEKLDVSLTEIVNGCSGNKYSNIKTVLSLMVKNSEITRPKRATYKINTDGSKHKN